MLYYQVKEKADQTRANIRFMNNTLIGRELYTSKEVQKSTLTPSQVQNLFNNIEARPKDTYFFFGCRFLRSDGEKKISIV